MLPKIQLCLPFITNSTFPYSTMPSLPSLPSIPIPPIIATLFSNFPLITYEAPPTSIPAPSLPTLWLLGPPPTSTISSPTSSKVLESLDPYCRILQSLARFLSSSTGGEEQQGYEVRWMENEYGVVGGRLPNLHLPDGSLLGRDEKGLNEYFKDPKKWRLNAGDTTTLVEEQKSLSYEAFEVLVQKTLLPAVLSLAYFSEKKSSNTSSKKVIEEEDSLPYLSSWVAWYDSIVKKQARVDEVKLLSSSKKGVLDLEEVERVGIETIGTLEIKFREDAYGAEGWFGGAVKATELDALIYSLLSLVLVLPGSTDSQLRRTLELSPNLMAWVKAKKP